MTITIGSAYTFASATGFGDKNFSIAALSDTSFVIVYNRTTDGLNYAVAGTISGTVITFGTPVSLGSGSTANKRAVCALSSTLALVIYGTNVRTLSISGTTITANTAATLDASAANLFSVTALDATTALAGYSISGTGYHVVVVSVSGTTCTVNTKQNIIATIPNDVSIDALSSTAAIIGYTDGSSSYPKAAVISISGTTPSLGSATTLESANTYTTGGQGGEKFCVAVDSGTAVMCWLNSSADDLRAAAMSISGTTVTGGSVVSLDSGITTGNGWMVTVTAPTTSRMVFSYTDQSTGNQYLRSAALSGTTITDNADKETITGTGTIWEGAVSAVGTGFVCAYNDGNLSYKAVAEATAGGTRVLDLAADFDYLYDTSLVSGVLTLNRYDHETLTGTALYTFGSASNSTIDNGTNALKLAVVPGQASTLYTWGYDGNGYQIQKSTDGGGTFTDVSGSWGSAVVTGFEINQFNPSDIVVSLNNDDIYQTTNAAASWTKTGDGPGADIVAIERHPVYPQALMIASSTAGDVDLTPNLGSSWGSANIGSGGTVNVIKKAL